MLAGKYAADSSFIQDQTVSLHVDFAELFDVIGRHSEEGNSILLRSSFNFSEDEKPGSDLFY